MVTKLKKHRQAEATDLLEKAQKDDDIFGKTARSISHWVDKYGDYQMAWHHGILYHLESWVELAEVSTIVRTHSPEMATAIGEFIDYHLDR
jgi:hypothetical protein